MRIFKLDISRGELFLEDETVRLRPKTLAVLLLLCERAGDVVSQGEIKSSVWGDLHGSDAGPKQCVRELRRLLGDDPAAPRFIETVGRQGYRLMGRFEMIDSGSGTGLGEPLCVGREAELARLNDAAATAREGARVVEMIAGETGAGKSRLIEAFIAGAGRAGPLWVAQGQCVPHAGAREPYGPLIEAVSNLAGGRDQGTVLRLAREVAPSWLDQIPVAGRAMRAASVVSDFANARPDSMLREFTALMEALSQRRPGILVLEDLHWADTNTLAWLLSWARRRVPSRLLVVGSYRFDEMHSARGLEDMLHELSSIQNVSFMALSGLDENAVSDYLARRFPGHGLPPVLGVELARKTEGLAILVNAVAERWETNGDLRWTGQRWALESSVEDLISDIAPGSARFIAGEIARLEAADRQILEAGSVAGARFSAAMLGDSRAEIEAAERRLENLSRLKRFVERAGVSKWPDGSESTRYAFRHALYQEALYEAVPAAVRQGMHASIGNRVEQAFGAQSPDIASSLADHFERAADWRRAAVYRGLSGLRALKRCAFEDAAQQFRQALALHDRCPPTEDLRSAECRTLLGLGSALIALDGFTAPELKRIYERANGLARQITDPETVFPALAGLWNHHVSNADLAQADQLAEALQELAVGLPPLYATVAHNAVGQTHFFGGDLAACLPHIEAVLGLYDKVLSAEAPVLFGEDPGIVSRQYAACAMQLLERSEDAERHFAEGMQLAAALDLPFGKAQMFWAGAIIAREREEPDLVLTRAQSLIDICVGSGILYWLPYGKILAGWAQVALGENSGMKLLREGLDASREMHASLTRPYGLALFADAARRCGKVEEGFEALREAKRLIQETGERWYEPGVRRLWREFSPETMHR